MKELAINRHFKEMRSKQFHISMNMQVSPRLKEARFPRIYKCSQTSEANGIIKENDPLLHQLNKNQ